MMYASGVLEVNLTKRRIGKAILYIPSSNFAGHGEFLILSERKLHVKRPKRHNPIETPET